MNVKSRSISGRDDIVCETADEIRHQRSVEYTTTVHMSKTESDMAEYMTADMTEEVI